MRLLIAALLAALSLPAYAAGPCSQPIPMTGVLEHFRAAAVPFEHIVSQRVVDSIVEQMHEVVEFDETPDEILLVYVGDNAGIALISDGNVCRQFKAPIKAVNQILKIARGIAV